MICDLKKEVNYNYIELGYVLNAHAPTDDQSEDACIKGPFYEAVFTRYY
jgi:hypothetical protein